VLERGPHRTVSDGICQELYHAATPTHNAAHILEQRISRETILIKFYYHIFFDREIPAIDLQIKEEELYDSKAQEKADALREEYNAKEFAEKQMH
jgi:hypothetical protein